MGLLLAHVATAQVVIQGKVVDVMTRKPLQGAKVQLDKQEVFVQTAADGSFTIGSVYPGYHTVTASCDGYEPESSAHLLFTYYKESFIALELQSMDRGVRVVNSRKTNNQQRAAARHITANKKKN